MLSEKTCDYQTKAFEITFIKAIIAKKKAVCQGNAAGDSP
jgi:hypothetical protein